MEERIYDILGKKFSGNPLTDEEILILSDWLKDQNNLVIANELEKTWNITGNVLGKLDPNIDLEWERFTNLRKNQKTRKINFAVLSGIAASVLIVISLVFLFRHNSTHVKIYSSANVPDTILLPDNSVVILNENSTLTLAENFNKKNRNVRLSGEAYFQVSHTGNTFEIGTSMGISATVLGTSFNLRAIQSEGKIDLDVTSGKVLFGNTATKKTAIISKGNSASYSINEASIKTEPIDENQIAWLTHKLKFDNTPLNDVSVILGEYFKKKFVFPKTSDKLSFSGSFTNASDSEIARILAASFQWEYQTNNNSYIFISQVAPSDSTK